MSEPEKIHPRYVINDALTLVYGDDGTGEMYWADGADLIVTMLIEGGYVPPEFDAPAADTPKAEAQT